MFLQRILTISIGKYVTSYLKLYAVLKEFWKTQFNVDIVKKSYLSTAFKEEDFDKRKAGIKIWMSYLTELA